MGASNPGIFTRNNVIDVGVQPRVLTVGDLDSDGDLDLAVANEQSNSVTILSNDGNGNFFVQVDSIPVGVLPTYISNADLNGDGSLDLVIVNNASNTLSVLMNQGQGNFQAQVTYNVGQSPQTCFLGNFNSDGFPDVVVTSLVENTVSLLVNAGNGTFQNPQSYATGGIEPHFVLGQDFNRDGNLDLAVVNRTSNAIAIMFNNGGIFSTPTAYPVGTDPLSLTAGDWDSDADPDLAVVNRLSNDLYIFINNGSGQFQIDSVYTTGLEPRFVSSADFDGDGDPDLAVANWLSNNVQIFQNQSGQNQPPGIPEPFFPPNRFFVNPDSTALHLMWRSPIDQDEDSLHFRVEIAQSPDFISLNFVFESKNNTAGFLPAPPVGQTTDTVSFRFTNLLQDDFYWWRVTAWDGLAYGLPTQPKYFIIDATPPKLDRLLLTSPLFPPNWYNPNIISSITFSVQYDESYARRAEFDLRALGGIRAVENISSGLDQTAAVSINLTGAADGSYPLSVALFDSAGNASKAGTTISLDATAPVGTRANSPDTSLAEKFVVSWAGTATDGAGSGISGVYDIRVQIDGGVWQNWLTTFAGVSAEYQGAQGHTYGFEAAAYDNVGNVEAFSGIAETATVVDTTAQDTDAPGRPMSLTAGGTSPSPWQKDPVFQIAWQAPIDPSGIDKALYKLGTPPVTNFDTTGSISTGSSVQITATQEHGQNFYLWFADRRDNVDFRNYGVVTLQWDNTPPTGTQASSPDTSRVETFLVSWGGTATDGAGSGISEIYSVKVRIDGGAWNDWRTNLPGESAAYQGAHGHIYGFEAAAHDNVGNVEVFSGTPETATVVDTSLLDVNPPSILHSPVPFVEEGTGITIQTQVQDNFQVVKATLFYKPGGKSDYQTIAMADLGNGNFEATLASEVISTRGINYFIEAFDGENFSYHPPENRAKPHNISVRVSGVNNQGLINANPQPGGSTQSAFRMISAPLILENPSAPAVLEDDLGPYDPKQWRLFLFNPASGGYDEFPSLDPFSPGKAFWLIVRQPNKQIDSGIGKTVETNAPFQMTLHQGWNDIGNPFVFPVNWSDVKVVQGDSTAIMGPYTYSGQWLLPDQVATLSPWEGYAVFSSMPAVTISISPIEAVPTSSQALWKPDDQTDWRLRLEAVCEEALDGENFVGVSQEASAEWDRLDFLEPPPIGEYVSLRFPHDDWQKYRGDFSTDLRPPFADGQVWDFEVETNILDAPISLKFLNRESIPASFRVILLDLTTLQRIDIQQSPQYTFMPDQRRLSRAFKLIVGTRAYIENSEAIKQSQPRFFSLSPNFPNPFNAGTAWLYQLPEPSHVSIKVLNVLGQEIRLLFSREQESGYYPIHWDGRDNDGREVGSGVYIIKLEAGRFRQSRKALLIR